MKSYLAAAYHPRRLGVRPLPIGLILLAAIRVSPSATLLVAGELELRSVDHDTNQPISARLQLTDARGRHPSPKNLVRHADAFVLPGRAVIQLAPGRYRYVLERGLEYHRETGSFVMSRGAADLHEFRPRRFVNMQALGWWSGDVWVDRPARDLELLAESEDLHLLGYDGDTSPPSPEAAATSSPALDGRGQFVAYPGGCLHGWHLSGQGEPFQPPATISGLPQLVQAPPPDLWIIAEPASWHLPAWLVTARMEACLVLRPDAPLVGQDGVSLRPRDELRFPDDPQAGGRNREFIYHQLLEAGFRLPPVAASASGSSGYHPGQFRTYVHIDGPFSPDAWWAGLRRGAVLVTNGPLMTPRVNGQFPGHVFCVAPGETITLSTTLTLHTRSEEPVEYLQFLKNGESVAEIRLDQWAQQGGGALPQIRFDESGWLQIRAVTSDRTKYQLAATGPYYVEVGSQPRRSRRAIRFFVDGLEAARSQPADQPAGDQQVEVPIWQAAFQAWETIFAQATTD